MCMRCCHVCAVQTDVWDSLRSDNFDVVQWVNSAIASQPSAGGGVLRDTTKSDDTHISALIAKLQVLSQVRWSTLLPATAVLPLAVGNVVRLVPAGCIRCLRCHSLDRCSWSGAFTLRPCDSGVLMLCAA
jgi:hypothetical protein